MKAEVHRLLVHAFALHLDSRKPTANHLFREEGRENGSEGGVGVVEIVTCCFLLLVVAAMKSISMIQNHEKL